MEYRFYGWESPDVAPADPRFGGIRNQRHMYDILDRCWSIETCAPRFRGQWSETNKTAGQCSITAFLVQDVFGGEVYGVPLPEGGFHCYNAVGSSLFDLTSEQFGDTVLEYPKENPQSREEHLADAGKMERYRLLREKMEKLLGIAEE